MDAYTSFAEVYDAFMDNIPYEAWTEYLAGLLREYGVEQGIVLDLGCGTGTLTQLLARKGYDMIGLDSSQEMLQIAMEKREQSGLDILYLCQDMREMELYGTTAAVVSLCDSMNYLLEYQDLVRVFRLVNNYLDPGGVFIFDMNTAYKYREVIGDSTIAESREACSFIWDNYYYEEEQINEYDLTLFIREAAAGEGTGQLYRKYTETHYQRGYTLDEIKELLQSAGLIFREAHDMETGREVSEKSERICVIAEESGKEI